MTSFISVTFQSKGQEPLKSGARCITNRRGKTFVTTINHIIKNKSKRVSFANDEAFENDTDCIQKPKPSRVASYIKNSPSNVLEQESREDIDMREMEFAIKFLKRKSSKKAWKPSRLRNLK